MISVTAIAQSVQIKQGTNTVSGSGYYCMPVNDPGTSFTVEGVDLSNGGVTGTIVSTTWTVAGGIQKVSESGTYNEEVSIAPMTGTTYATQYSKYAKGKLIANCSVKYEYKYSTVDCDSVVKDSLTYTYYVDYTAEVEIRKVFDMPDGLTTNAIVGPICVSPGDSVTYSVAPWVSLYQMNQVGFDSYSWIIPQGLSASDLYYSADSSSVTFTAGTDIAGKTLSVTMGACNTSQTPLTFTLGQEPADPIFEGKDLNSYCLPFGTLSDTIIISNPQPGATYTWDLRSWTANHISAVGDTIIYTPLNNAQTITLKMSGGCTDKQFIYDINRSLNPTSEITTQYGTCLPKNSDVKFSIDGVPVGTEMNWSLDATALANGWTISAAEAKNATPTIHIGNGAGRVYAETADCGSTSVYGDFQVGVTTPNAIDASSTCLARVSENLTFEIPTTSLVDGAEGYNWQFPATWSITSANADSSTVNVTTDGATAGVISVRAHGCDISNWFPLQLNLEADKPDGIDFSQTCINVGTTDTITCTVQNAEAVTYIWDATDFGDIITNNNSSVVVVTNGIAGDKTIGVQVAAAGTCSASAKTDETLTASTPGYYISYFGAFNTYFATLTGSFDNPCTTCTYKWWLCNNGTATLIGTSNFVQPTAINFDIVNSTQYLLICDIISTNGCRVRTTYGKGPEPSIIILHYEPQDLKT